MYPFKLKPIYDKTIWASNKLTSIRGIKEEGYGTCWEVSAHPSAKNEISNGEYKGRTLYDVINEFEKEVIGDHDKEELLRVAYLDAKDDLSIQVHPDMEYAKKHENDLGKTEAWYILEADEGATLVAGTLSNDENVIRKALKDENLEAYLRKVEMHAGDFILVEAGMLHALGGGILAIEVGTNSNTTYRFYDYNRKDANGNGRELHLDKSFDVTDFNKQSQKVATPFCESSKTTRKVLVDCDGFCVELYDVVGEIELDTLGKDFHTVSFVHNDGYIEYNGKRIDMKYTEDAFIPADCGKYKIIGNVRVLKSFVK